MAELSLRPFKEVLSAVGMPQDILHNTNQYFVELVYNEHTCNAIL